MIRLQDKMILEQDQNELLAPKVLIYFKTHIYNTVNKC
jgi:hypothetical protein